MKNVMIDETTSPLAVQIAEAFAHRPEIERLVGVESKTSSHWSPQIDLIAPEPDHRRLLEYLCDYEIDTVIQCSLARDRTGASCEPSVADVIGTMRLGAAIGHAKSPVRSWVVLSSSAVYPINSNGPLLKRETNSTVADQGATDTGIVEAEEYAASVALRVPHLNVAILRLQELIGDSVRGPLASHFDSKWVPAAIGYDPVLQFLHIEDAVAAVTFAGHHELAGLYNVASRGVIRFSDLLEAIGRGSIGLPPFEVGPLAPLAALLGLPHIANGLLDCLRFGHALDTQKIERAGFKPKADQLDCAAVL